MEKELTVPKLIAILAAVVALVTFFLPLISFKDSMREYYLSRADEKAFESLDMTYGEMVDISMYDYARVYFEAGEEVMRSKDMGILYGCLTSSVAVFALLIILSALGKKTILTLILDALFAGAFAVIIWDFNDRGIMPVSTADWGIAYFVFYPVAVIIALAAIWMFVVKHKNKKQKKLELSMNA